jgi:hypothetical protein
MNNAGAYYTPKKIADALRVYELTCGNSGYLRYKKSFPEYSPPYGYAAAGAAGSED